MEVAPAKGTTPPPLPLTPRSPSYLPNSAFDVADKPGTIPPPRDPSVVERLKKVLTAVGDKDRHRAEELEAAITIMTDERIPPAPLQRAALELLLKAQNPHKFRTISHTLPEPELWETFFTELKGKGEHLAQKAERLSRLYARVALRSTKT